MTKHQNSTKSCRTVVFGLVASLLLGVQFLSAQTLDPTSLTKYVDELPVPAKLDGTSSLHIGMYQITQQLHSELPATTVWAYGTDAAHAYYPGPTIEAVRGVTTRACA